MTWTLVPCKNINKKIKGERERELTHMSTTKAINDYVFLLEVYG